MGNEMVVYTMLFGGGVGASNLFFCFVFNVRWWELEGQLSILAGGREVCHCFFTRRCVAHRIFGYLLCPYHSGGQDSNKGVYGQSARTTGVRVKLISI